MTSPFELRRLPDWQLRLEAFVQRRQAEPFAWGWNDCCMFAADAVLALTGRDVAPALRGTCPSARQALRYLRRRGGIAGVATAALGAAVAPAMARVGDVVMVTMGKRLALGVCMGTAVLGPGPHGAVSISMTAAVAAWRVG